MAQGVAEAAGFGREALAVFVEEEEAGEMEARQDAAAVRRIGDVREMQAQHGVADAVFALRGVGEAPAAAEVGAVLRDLVAVGDEAARHGEAEAAGDAGDVGHVVAADVIVRVADAVRVCGVGGEEEAGGFEAAEGEDDPGRGNGEHTGVEGADGEGFDRGAVVRGDDVRDVGTEDDADGGAGGEFVRVARCEVRREREALDAVGVEVWGGEAGDGGAHAAGDGGAGVVIAGAGLAKRVGRGIPGGEVFRGDGPAGAGDGVAAGQVERVQRDAAAAPEGGGAAEAADAVGVGGRVQGGIGDGAGVEGLRDGVGAGAA